MYAVEYQKAKSVADAAAMLAKTPGLCFVKRLDWRAMPPVRVCVHSANRP